MLMLLMLIFDALDLVPLGEGLVLPRGRTVAVSNIPRGATSAQLSALLVKYGPVRQPQLALLHD